MDDYLHPLVSCRLLTTLMRKKRPFFWSQVSSYAIKDV